MQIFLILFLTSLLGIAFLVGRKVRLIRKGELNVEGEFPWKIPETHEVKHLASKSLKRLGYVVLVLTIRSYIKGADFLKENYSKIKEKLKNNIDKRISKGTENQEQKEPSRFLKMISDYKEKIKEIKDRIVEEERTK